MGLRTWTTEIGGTSGNSKIRGGFRWQVTNSDEDRITNNRSVVRIEGMGYVTESATTYNLNDHTSYYIANGSQQNYTSRVDFRSATPSTYYYVATDTGVFPKGNYKEYTINHDEDGTKTISVTSFIAIPGTSADPGITLTKNITLPAIDRGIIDVNVGGVWKQGILYVNVGGVWKQAIKVSTNVSGTWKQSI